MQRFALALFLLAAAAAVQAITPSRQDANGAGSTCPEAEASQADDEARVGETAEPAPAAAKQAVPTPSKGGSVAKTRTGTRWHSFLPGMFK